MNKFNELLNKYSEREKSTSRDSVYNEANRMLNQDEFDFVNTLSVKETIINTIKSLVETEVSKNIGAQIKLSKIDYQSKQIPVVEFISNPIKVSTELFKDVYIKTGFSSISVLDEKVFLTDIDIELHFDLMSKSSFIDKLCNISAQFDKETGKVVKTQVTMRK